MKQKTPVIGIVAAIVIVLLALISANALRPRDTSQSNNEQDARRGGRSNPHANVELTAQAKPTSGSDRQNAPEVSPATTALEESASRMVLLGTVQAGAQATLSARMPARIVSVGVRQGDTVRQGQTIVQLDATDFQTQLRTAQAGVVAAQAQVRKAIAGREAQRIKADADVLTAQSGLRQAQVKQRQAILARNAARDDQESERRLAQEGVRKAQAGLEQSRRTLRSLEELAKVGGVSRNDLEGARTQVRVAQSDLVTAQTQARRLDAGPNSNKDVSYRVALAQQDVDAADAGVRQATDGVRSAEDARKRLLTLAEEDIRSAEAALAQAKAGVTGAQSAIASMRISSPISGVVSSLEARTGETAQPGMPLATLLSLSGLRVDALVTARQIPQLHLSQTGEVRVDTLPGRVFPIKVSEIARTAEPDGRSFRIRLKFLQPAATLRPGQAACITLAP